MATNPVAWFEIPVNDMDRAVAFYKTVFAYDEMRRVPMDDLEMAWFRADMDSAGSAGTLVKHNEYTPSHDGTMVYFSCEDCAVEESRVAAAGGTVLRPKMSIGEYGFVSVVEDTEGNRIGLHSMK
jgi:predicted enzyme related to lactoylglutathione lyase